MFRTTVCALACLALFLLAGCGSRAERNEMRDDLTRFRQMRVVEYEQLKRDLARYAVDHQLRAQELPIDLAHFLEWRHREWWNLTDSLAALITYEWDMVQKLVEDAARFYGYEVRNFPRLGDDVARFFEHADEEWARLVRDVCIFVEWKNRELLPLRRELREAYERVGWEAANIQVDVLRFAEWRDREWRRMKEATAALVFVERGQGRRLREDLRRFRAARALEATYLVADLKAWWHYEVHAMPPRLLSDVWRWSQLPPREMARLQDDVVRFGEGVGEDALKLVDDLNRFATSNVDLLPLLVADVDRFFEVYEREWGPLTAGVRRWWRSNVGLGIVLREDMRLFFIEHGRTETAELQASVGRFVTYAGKEWKDFRAALGRFFHDDSGRAFGDRSVPMRGDTGRPVFDDPRAYPVRGYGAGRE